MKNGMLIRICFVLYILFISSHAYPQTSDNWEVLFDSEGCEGLTRSADAYAQGTRWLYEDQKPTSGYYHRFNSDTGNVQFGFDAPGSYICGTSDDDLAYGYYQFVFNCSDGYTRTFYIDFRDYNWSEKYSDLHVMYFKSTLTLKIAGSTGWKTISQNAVYKIWELYVG